MLTTDEFAGGTYRGANDDTGNTAVTLARRPAERGDRVS
jgi:hypothetical protein